MTAVQEPEVFSQRALLAPGVEAIRRYWRPFVLLQACALGLVICYFKVPRVTAACLQLAAWKEAAGLPMAALGAVVAGAILPEIAKALVMGEWAFGRERMRTIGFNLALFAGAGIMINAQYQAFGMLFGFDSSVATVAKKVLVDQFVTTPLYGNTYWVFLYGWRANRYRIGPTLRQVNWRWYMSRVAPLLLPGWVYWIPMVILTFSLPTGLQFCLWLLALAAWSLIMVFLANRPSREAETRGGELGD